MFFNATLTAFQAYKERDTLQEGFYEVTHDDNTSTYLQVREGLENVWFDTYDEAYTAFNKAETDDIWKRNGEAMDRFYFDLDDAEEMQDSFSKALN